MDTVRTLALIGLVLAAWLGPLAVLGVSLRIRALITAGRLPTADADLFPIRYFQLWNPAKLWSPRVETLKDPELRSQIRLFRRMLVGLAAWLAGAAVLAAWIQAKS